MQVDMLYELLEASDALPQESMIMLSMDGPNTNWKFYEVLKSQCTEKEFPQITDVGSCGLHLVHGAFQTCMKANDWKSENILKAWRDLYLQMSILDVFPLRFCQTCWVEDEPVAIQAIEVSENVVNVIKHFQTLLCKSKQLSKNNL